MLLETINEIETLKFKFNSHRDKKLKKEFENKLNELNLKILELIKE